MAQHRKPMKPWIPPELAQSVASRVKYDAEFCENLADHMIDEVTKNKDMYLLRPYFSSKGIPRDIIKLCCEISDKFRLAYKACKQICADRFHTLVLQSKLNSYYASKMMTRIDDEHWEHVIEDKRLMSRAQVEGATEAGAKENCIQFILKD